MHMLTADSRLSNELQSIKTHEPERMHDLHRPSRGKDMKRLSAHGEIRALFDGYQGLVGSGDLGESLSLILSSQHFSFDSVVVDEGLLT